MTTLDHNSTAVLLEAAVPEFGGRPYGLEPLVLPLRPAPGDPDLPRRDQDPSGTLGTSDSAEQLFWFRWITGHQLTFIFWQEIGRRADRAPDAGDVVADVRSATRLIRAYSAMLLYTASCTRDVYHRVIRPSMALHHPAFSGAWARDYGPVRALLRGRLPASWAAVPDAAALAHECAVNEAVHEGIAAKLVPEAPSLLQSSANEGRALPRDVRAVLFDTYFLTLRASSTPEDVATQMLRRVRAVQDDLRVNGLYPAFAESRHEKPDTLTVSEVVEIEREMPHLLGATAGHAIARQPPQTPSAD
ncbi:hypothetical protein AB0C10_29655 [Microbispora amethystogenes]|uniref:hypothetical protein n=1 Tax=Microbispora amethystogenes TaxID=1427754 RepID=UPI0033EDF349